MPKEGRALEYQVARERVLPYLHKMGFPDQSIQGYGRVPVQMGRDVFWADYVCYYYTNGRRRPFCVVEVKIGEGDVDLAIPQAQSYAHRLDALYFCCTNGERHHWYMTGGHQGGWVKLSGAPTLPETEYLEMPRGINMSPYLREAMANFENTIRHHGELYEDTCRHHEGVEMLREMIHTDGLSQEQVVATLESSLMRARGRAAFIREVQKDFQRFVVFLRYLRSEVPIEEKIDACIAGSRPNGFPDAGPHTFTQLLAGVAPREYCIVEEKATRALQRFGLADVSFDVVDSRSYLYFNDICVQLYREFSNESDFNLTYVHNFLWHHEDEVERKEK